MPRIAWPTRRISCATLGLVNNTDVFSVGKHDEGAMAEGTAATLVDGADRSPVWIRLAPEGRAGYRLSTNSSGSLIKSPVPAFFALEKQACAIVNYPRRPMLVDPAAVAVTSVTNPRRISAWTIGEPRFEGSVQIEALTAGDVAVVEAFIDALFDLAAWFEVPLPGEHIGDSDISAFDASSGDIDLSAAYSDTALLGAFGRVGRRTCRVVHYSDRLENNAVVHTIRIAPASLIDGTTADNAGNVFASGATCRARATKVSATGDPDFGARWTIDWEETRGEDVIT